MGSEGKTPSVKHQKASMGDALSCAIMATKIQIQNAKPESWGEHLQHGALAAATPDTEAFPRPRWP